MPQFSNSDKQEHGKNAKDALEQILLECKKFSYIKEIETDYRCGYAEYDNKQFYCNFVITFQDDTKWIVNITTSFRSDRLKGNQWDSYNIKEIDSSISKIKSGTLRVDIRFPNSLRINPFARNKAFVAASRRFSPPKTE